MSTLDVAGPRLQSNSDVCQRCTVSLPVTTSTKSPRVRARKGPAPTLSKLPGRDDSKLAERVASLIAEDIIARGWPVGEVLGSAADYAQRYNVSRAVFREAVRLLEDQEVIRTQRGAAGGIIVTEPSLENVTDAAVLYLQRVDARVEEVLEARSLLAQIVSELVSKQLDTHGRQRLEAYLSRERAGELGNPNEFHSMLASLTGNPALELFVHILNRVTILYRRNPTSDLKPSDQIRRAHERIIRAILSGDAGLAAEAMRRHLRTESDLLVRQRAMRQLLTPVSGLTGPVGEKGAERVAREIYQSIVSARLAPGHFVGYEPALAERYGVSRMVFREAVRLLEHHHIARMRRGTGGGLIVETPNSAAVTDVVALYLARRETSLAALAELRVRVEVALVDLVIDHLDEVGAEALESAAILDEGDENTQISIHNLHMTMAAFCGNRALELVALVLIRLTRFHQSRDLTDADRLTISTGVQRAHVAVADAIRAGDRELAKKRTLRHLEALSSFLG